MKLKSSTVRRNGEAGFPHGAGEPGPGAVRDLFGDEGLQMDAVGHALDVPHPTAATPFEKLPECRAIEARADSPASTKVSVRSSPLAVAQAVIHARWASTLTRSRTSSSELTGA